MQPALVKLKIDAARFKADQALGHGLKANLRLILVVDFWPVLWFRLMEHCTTGNVTYLKKIIKALVVLFRPIAEGFSGARIMPGAEIGAGLLLHQSVGVVICAEAIIGTNCTFYANACVVHRADGKGLGAPVIGNDVAISIGSYVVGHVRIGDGVIVGANSVVLKDIAAGCVAAGSPARVL